MTHITDDERRALLNALDGAEIEVSEGDPLDDEDETAYLNNRRDVETAHRVVARLLAVEHASQYVAALLTAAVGYAELLEADHYKCDLDTEVCRDDFAPQQHETIRGVRALIAAATPDAARANA